MNFILKQNINGDPFFPLKVQGTSEKRRWQEFKDWGMRKCVTKHATQTWQVVIGGLGRKKMGPRRKRLGYRRGNGYAYNQSTLYICIKLSKLEEKCPLQIPPSQHHFLEIGMQK